MHPCPHFPTCGGCQLQHLEREQYYRFKEDAVRTALQAGKLSLEGVDIRPIKRIGDATRRRIQLKVEASESPVSLGFYAPHSHDVVDIDTCLVTHPALWKWVAPLRALITSLSVPKLWKEVHLTLHGDAQIDMLIVAK